MLATVIDRVKVQILQRCNGPGPQPIAKMQQCLRSMAHSPVTPFFYDSQQPHPLFLRQLQRFQLHFDQSSFRDGGP
jgi:hypothetical protein